jgi:hypothetical protein
MPSFEFLDEIKTFEKEESCVSISRERKTSKTNFPLNNDIKN